MVNNCQQEQSTVTTLHYTITTVGCSELAGAVLTLVMVDQLLQSDEGDARRDVKASIVQGSDLVMFDCDT